MAIKFLPSNKFKEENIINFIILSTITLILVFISGIQYREQSTMQTTFMNFEQIHDPFLIEYRYAINALKLNF